jgi:hypothetical protein
MAHAFSICPFNTPSILYQLFIDLLFVPLPAFFVQPFNITSPHHPLFISLTSVPFANFLCRAVQESPNRAFHHLSTLCWTITKQKTLLIKAEY